MSGVSPEFYWIAVAVITVLSAARLTRLAVADKFPPVAAIRDWYIDKTDSRPQWQYLAFCPYCAGPWLTLLVLLSGWLTDWHTAWWVFNGWLAASYLASIVVVFDGGYDDANEGDD